MRICLLIIIAFWFLPVSSQTLRIMGADEGFLPFYYGENLNKGIFAEVIKEFALEAGITAELRPIAQTPGLGSGRRSCQRRLRQSSVDAIAGPNARRRAGVNLA